MSLPPPYRDIILSGLEPGEAYRQCLARINEEGRTADYALTEAIAYSTEIRYVIRILTSGRLERAWNFGDLQGDADARLWALLERFPVLNVAFVGSGPYPVTALLLRQRYSTARITCIDNNVTAYFLGQAVFERLNLDIACQFDEAMAVEYGAFNVVIVAAMVSGKCELVKRILDTSDALIILRGAVPVQHPRLVQFGTEFRDDGAICVVSP